MIGVIVLIGLLGAVLGYAASRLGSDEHSVVEQVNAILPQTQCGQCGYPGCLPYARAIVDDEVAINQCPPGGAAGIAELAELLGREPLPLNPENGAVKPAMVARIVEEDCIGCTKCIQDCPVDAIVGSARMMHTVIASECTGCELCLPPCPVDCIILIPVDEHRRPLPGPEPLTVSLPT